MTFSVMFFILTNRDNQPVCMTDRLSTGYHEKFLAHTSVHTLMNKSKNSKHERNLSYIRPGCSPQYFVVQV